MEKMMIKASEGGKKERPPVDYGTIYLRGMMRAVEPRHLDPDKKDYIKRFVFYGIKFFSVYECGSMNRKELENRLDLNDVLLNYVCKLTPAELMNIFPIEKIYYGQIYGFRNYFITMEALQAHGLNEPIQTKEKANSLLLIYQNETIMDYRENIICATSKICSMNTGKCMVEVGFNELGFEIPACFL
jgi:hypothetical protein